MSNNSLQIFMEYKIKPHLKNEYELAMKRILDELPVYGASHIQWFEATEQDNLYVEMFEVPTTAHFQALKKLRKEEGHHTFDTIMPFIEGGVEKIHCWAFKRK